MEIVIAVGVMLVVVVAILIIATHGLPPAPPLETKLFDQTPADSIPTDQAAESLEKLRAEIEAGRQA